MKKELRELAMTMKPAYRAVLARIGELVERTAAQVDDREIPDLTDLRDRLESVWQSLSTVLDRHTR